MGIAKVLGIMAGLFAAVIISVLLLLSQKSSGPQSADVPASVQADRIAPSAKNNPMIPVTSAEASRRSTLHDEMLESAVEDNSNTYIAPPVVTNVKSSKDDDELTRALFEDNQPYITTPPPAAVKPEPEQERKVVAVEPEPETKPEPKTESKAVPVAQPDRALYPYLDKYRERMNLGTGRGFEYNVMKKSPPGDQSSLLGSVWNGFASIFVGTAYAGGYVAPIESMEPTYMEPYSYSNMTMLYGEDNHNAPNPAERSAARPMMVGIDAFGDSYATQEYHDERQTSLRGSRQVLARAGDLVYARLLYGFNSDDLQGRPIYALVTDIMRSGDYGPLHDARIEGTIQYSDDNAAITFNSILLADGRSIPMTGIAISADTARAGVAQRVDRHILSRYGSLFVAGLLQGLGEVAQARLERERNTPTIIVTGEGTVNIDNSDVPSDRDIAYGAMRPIGENFSAVMMDKFNRPPTITAPAGHIFGVVFVQTLVFDPATMTGIPAYNPRTGGTSDVRFAPNPTIPQQTNPNAIQQPLAGQSIQQQQQNLPPGGYYEAGVARQ